MPRKLLNQIIKEEFTHTLASERKNGLVAKAFQDRNLKEYQYFMNVYHLLPKKHQVQIYKPMWSLLQKAFDLGYAIGRREEKL